jgi:hypothetical protein
MTTHRHDDTPLQDICIKYFLVLFSTDMDITVFGNIFSKGTLFNLNSAQSAKIVA